MTTATRTSRPITGKPWRTCNPCRPTSVCWSCPRRTPRRAGSPTGSAPSCGTPGSWAEDHEFTRLVPVDTSEAERGQAATYRPGDVMEFHQNAKGLQQRRAADRRPTRRRCRWPRRQKFSLYRPEAIALAEGDRIRFTGTVKTLDGEHTLKNGMTKTVAGFTGNGNIRLDNGWVVAADAGHFRHGLRRNQLRQPGQHGPAGDSRHASAASWGAINQEQMYVSATRASNGCGSIPTTPTP